MPSKFYYCLYKEQSNIQENDSNVYLEIAKNGFDALKAVEWLDFTHEAHKRDQQFSGSNRDFNEFSILAFFFEIKGYFTKKSIQWFQL